MPIEVQLARVPAYPILNDRGIKKALDKRLIRLSTEISDDQIQPGSLDARIGEVYVFDDESRIAISEQMSKITSPIELDAYEAPRSVAKFYSDEKGKPIIIPPRAFAEIYFHEKISFSITDFNLSYELRSSRGRLGLKPHSAYPRMEILHGIEIINDEHGMYAFPKVEVSNYVEVTNVNNDNIILYGHDKFANIFFNLQRRMRLDQGKAVWNPRMVKKLLPEFAKQNMITPEGYLIFKIGKEAKTFKRGKVIDTAHSIDDSFYDTHDLSKGYVLNTETPAIVQLTPNVALPANLGIRLLHRIPFHSNMQQYGFAIADFNQVNAGWVDQGYKGAITAHPVYYMRPRLLREGDVFCFGMVYKFNTDSDRVYGTRNLGSHYQNSKGATTAKS